MRRTAWTAAAMTGIVVLAGCGEGTTTLVGMGEGREVAVAGKLAGRIAEVRCEEGDTLRAGDTVALIGSPEVDAKVLQAEGAVRSAEAKLSMARHGARPEEIRMAASAAEQATQGRILAEATWKRVQALLADSAIPLQQADEVRMRWQLAVQTELAAKARLEMTRKGARSEEIDGARGLVESARNALAEAKSWQKESAVLAPTDGVVQKRYLAQGEVAGAGSPIVVLVRPQDTWATVAVREDMLAKLPIGATLEADIPALALSAVPFKVVWHSSMGDFATWRATSRKGDVDLRSFEVRLEPVRTVPGFLPGMSVRLTLPAKG